jgi:acetyl-CoA carboxylase biotin carboxyl carrier protein
VEAKQVKDLMAAMGRTGMRRLVIKREGFELELEREGAENTAGGRWVDQGFDYVEDNPMRSDIEQHRSQAFGRRSSDGDVGQVEETKTSSVAQELNGESITSPMVGTFYASPSPEDPAFVKIGDRVEASTIVCIIEAMKVMNEVKAGISGVVAQVLVDSGQPIEFGTKLFRINTD